MSVAIRAITQIQEADDAPTLGAGQDGYALTWDNASGAFVATAVSGIYLPLTGGTLTGTLDAASRIDINGSNDTGGTIGEIKFFNDANEVANIKVLSTTGSGKDDGTFVFSTSLNGMLGEIFRLPRSGAIPFTEAGVTFGDSNAGVGISGVSAVSLTLSARHDLYLYSNLRAGNVFHFNRTGYFNLYALNDDTNTVFNAITIDRQTTGTPAAGFGAGLLFQLESSTTAAQSAARIQALWYEATHATRKADLVLTAYDTAEREGLRIRGAGSAAAIGFLGATPIVRKAHVADPSGGATVDAEARSAINSILATLEDFGFHATS